MFLDPLAAAYALLALAFPPVRSKLAAALPETTKRRRMFKNQIVPQYKKACQKISSMCQAKFKLACDRFEEFIDLMSCIDVDIHDEKSLLEHFARGREQIKEAAPLLRSAYKGAFSAAVDLENYKDHERIQAYSLAFSCQLYIYFDDMQMMEKSFSRLLKQLYSDQHLKGHIKKFLQEKDGYSLKHFSKVAIYPYSRKAIYAFQNITNHLKDIIHEICMDRDLEMEKRLLDAIIKPSQLNRKYHRIFTCNWPEEQSHMVERQLAIMAAALFDSQSHLIATASSNLHLQVIPNKLLTPEICIRGVTGSDLLCLIENKSQAVIYDSLSGRIVRINILSENLNEPSPSELHFDWPKFIRGSAKCVALRLHTTKSEIVSSETLLALICEQEIGTRRRKIYLVSIDLSDKFVSLAGHHILGEEFDEAEPPVEPHLVQDASGQTWCIIFQRFRAKSTKIKAYKMDNKCRFAGQPQISVLVNGLWSFPFIAKDSLCCLPSNTGDVSRCEKMLTVDLSGTQRSELVSLTSFSDGFPSCSDSIWSEPCVVHDTYVAVYIFKKKERIGAIWLLNCKENKWTMCFEIEETCHAICNRISLCLAHDCKLILHGECAVELCADAAHILFLDIGSSGVDEAALFRANSSASQAIEDDRSSSSHSQCSLQAAEGDLMWFPENFQNNNVPTIEPMNYQRGNAAVVVLDGSLYAVGGKDESATFDSCERFDPSSNEWKFVASMKHRRSGAGVTVLDGFIYAIGGFDGDVPLTSSERYSPKADEWTLLPELSSARGNLGAVAINGCVYAIGGNDGTRYLNSIEVYNPLTKEWTPMSAKKSITSPS